jgi:DNA mismatch endonuclease, patch repair protein
MRAITSRGNRTTEARLRSMLVRAGVRGWRIRPSGISGTPDFVFREARVVVFVDGCFWHGCPRCGHIPRTNAKYWTAKIARNQRRDRRTRRALRANGYRVVAIWECALKRAPGRCLARIRIAASPGS